MADSAVDPLDAAYAKTQSPGLDPLDAAYHANTSIAPPASNTNYAGRDTTPQAIQAPSFSIDYGAIGNRLKNAAYGAVKGAADLVQGPAQLAVNAAALSGNQYLKDKATQYNKYLADQEAQYQADTANSLDAGVGRVASSVAPFIASGGATAAPAATGGIGRAAAQGALYGAITPDTSNPSTPNQYAINAAKRAALGAGTNALMKVPAAVASFTLHPTVSPEVQTLVDAGVTPTLGQILGGGFKSAEDKATSIPFVGDMIKNARVRTMEDFNTAALNRAGVGATEGGQAGIGDAQDYFNQGYGHVLGQMTHVPDQQFENDVLTAAARNRIGTRGMDELGGMIRENYVPNFTANANGVPVMSGNDIKTFQQQLRQAGNAFSRSQDPIDQRVGDAYGDVRQAFRNSLARQNPPDLVDQLNALDNQYASFKQYQNAALGAGALKREGMITPADYLNSITKDAKSTGNTGALSAGGARNQDFGNAAQEVLGNTYPDSGTAGRMAIGALGGAAVSGGLAAHPVASVATALGGGVAALPYTELGQRATSALLTAPRPGFVETAANLLNNSIPIISTAMRQRIYGD